MTAKPENDAEKAARIVMSEMERKLQDMFGPEHRTAAQIAFGGALRSLTRVAQQSKDSFQNATELVSDLAKDLKEVESFSITPKPPAEIDVDIRIKNEKHLPFSKNVAPFVDIDLVVIAKRVHFQALVDTSQNGLRCNINEGFSVRFKTFLGKQTVPINGTAILKRDAKKQIVMEASTKLPGVDLPVSFSIPLDQLLREAKKHVFD
jgi:hypothetical protein